MSVSFEEFCDKFTFRPHLRGHVGVEREFFLTDEVGTPVPNSHDFLTSIGDPTWTYELSACQVEHRTNPHVAHAALLQDLTFNHRRGETVAKSLGLYLAAIEVANEQMITAIYPHDGRYAEIAERIGPAKLLAACRVAGVHLHLGASNLQQAIHIHNLLAMHLPELCRMGDHSNGERLRLYTEMAIRGEPPLYQSVKEFYEDAVTHGFAENPRDCWNLVRVSRHGTVELRMFGMTGDENEILNWVQYVTYIAQF